MGLKILDGYFIYKTSAGPNEVPKYMYAGDVYLDNWMVKDLQGLVRWRIIDFEDFEDETSCRTESENVNKVDFASNGQPYNKLSLTYCFGDNEGELNGYTSSTIDIHCNDRAPPVGYNGDGTLNMGGNASAPIRPAGDPCEDQSKFTLLLGISLLTMSVSYFTVYFLYKLCSKRQPSNSKSDGRAPTQQLEEHNNSESDHNDRQ